jgi:hypothetical protein
LQSAAAFVSIAIVDDLNHFGRWECGTVEYRRAGCVSVGASGFQPVPQSPDLGLADLPGMHWWRHALPFASLGKGLRDALQNDRQLPRLLWSDDEGRRTSVLPIDRGGYGYRPKPIGCASAGCCDISATARPGRTAPFATASRRRLIQPGPSASPAVRTNTRAREAAKLLI